MIRVLCLNPTIDRMYYIDDFKAGVPYFGNVPETYAAGKGVNIVRALCAFGVKPALYSFVGGTNGQRIVDEAAILGAEGVFFHQEGETRMTINIIDRKTGQETEIKETGASISANGQQEFLDRLEKDLESGDMVICSGRPARGMAADIYRLVAEACERKDARCVLDASGDNLKEAFPGTYYFVKPNENELAELFGLGKIEAQAQNLLGFGAENVMISLGSEGAVFVNKDVTYRIEIPKVDVVSTIGSGDAAVAGFCYGAERGEAVETCVKYAMAFGISNALHSEAGHVVKSEVEQLLSKIEIR